MTSIQTYEEKLQTLSEGSVHQHFDPWLDIDWDNPDYAITHDDPRWVLPKADALGRSEWYQSLPLDRQIEVGLWRQANVTKVGLQFENILIRGLMEYVMGLPNGSPEYRYVTHEATEETHHTQMFQEFVNRTGIDVPGGPRYFRAVAPFLPLAARPLSIVFFMGVLAGEEPIDHLQKAILREGAGPNGEGMHPLLVRIMQIHIAEEARHISFAHEYLKRNVPRAGRISKGILSVVLPVMMRVLGDAIMVPGKEMTRDVGVPKKVLKEVFWDSPGARAMLSDVFYDVRALAEELDLMNPVSRRVWKALKIDGAGARYRSEPVKPSLRKVA